LDRILGMLVRKLIGKRLADYYSQPSSLVVGSANAVDLKSLWGEWHWMRSYQRLYEEQVGQWLTPVELFKPHFSNILGNFIIQNDSSSNNLVEIVELGGGRGTNACFILDYLQKTMPDLYERATYTIIDNSAPLLELQKETISQHGNHMAKVNQRQLDLMDVAEKRLSLFPPPPTVSSQPQPQPPTTTIVLALELLDNLPHDKIRVRGGGHFIEQAQVVDHMEEVFVPLSDPLLKQVLQSSPTYYRRSRGAPVVWIPTVACGVLQQLVLERPQAQLLIADFDWLPPPNLLAVSNEERSSVWGHGEPIVTSMDDVDHECYLRAPELCDILFPTDFGRLASFAQTLQKETSTVTVQKQAQFLQATGPEHVHDTKSWLTGYTPLLHDFGNCSVLTVTNSRQSS
jgi:SAM-dependent MidA family methyltransferase